jgi:hypothetical protein
MFLFLLLFFLVRPPPPHPSTLHNLAYVVCITKGTNEANNLFKRFSHSQFIPTLPSLVSVVSVSLASIATTMGANVIFAYPAAPLTNLALHHLSTTPRPLPPNAPLSADAHATRAHTQPSAAERTNERFLTHTYRGMFLFGGRS